MPCQSCVDKLAYKLVRNHPKLDLIRARELAEKAVGRVENRVTSLPKRTVVIVNGVEVDPDYSLACVKILDCKFNVACAVNSDCGCGEVGDCGCDCPAPLPNSHYVSDDCLIFYCVCVKGVCPPTQTQCSGSCNYACDEGYTWNGSECVPTAPAVGYQYSDGLVSIQV
jgi:hypothetical protein